MTELTTSQLSPRALHLTDEVVRVGLDRFFAKYPPGNSSGYLVPLGEHPVPAQSAAAALGLGPLSFKTESHRRAAETKLLAHGLRMLPRAVHLPPQVGEAYPDRSAIKRRYGGDLVAGIVKFPGDPVVNCFADESGAYADDPPTRDGAFGYRGDGLTGDQKLTSPGNKRMESARLDNAPVRFWHKPRGGNFTFEMWCRIVGRHWGWGKDSIKQDRREVVWLLSAVDSLHQLGSGESVGDVAPDSAADMDDLVGPEAQPNPSYAELVQRLQERSPVQRVNNRVRKDPARSLAARRSVLARADSRCESPWCTGMAADNARTGGALLEVDHVKDLALGGDDHPSNMVALCPNCHAAKTRGDRADYRRKQLQKVAQERHMAAMAINPRARS
jgi:5-methylcytosine-specific restriction protein A